MTVERQRANVAAACKALAPVAEDHELVISHGNGPQVGPRVAGSGVRRASAYLFDVLGAQTEGMIGYLIEQELGNLLPFEKPLATVLTMTEVARTIPRSPSRPSSSARSIPTLTHIDRRRTGLDGAQGWQHMASRGSVANPAADLRGPSGRVAAGARLRRDLRRRRRHPYDVPRRYPDPGRRGAVIDKDRASAVLAEGLGADLLVIATDVDAVYLDWSTPEQRAVAAAHPDAVRTLDLPARWAPRPRQRLSHPQPGIRASSVPWTTSRRSSPARRVPGSPSTRPG